MYTEEAFLSSSMFHPTHNTHTHNSYYQSRIRRTAETDRCPRYSAVGAGDTFIAGMLYGLICHPGDWSTGRKLGFAVQLATLKVQREGFDGLGADMLKTADWRRLNA
jgi:fructose-1-phosphate kinase PfkB-like protein